MKGVQCSTCTWTRFYQFHLNSMAIWNNLIKSRIVKIITVYAISGWLVIQIASTVFPIYSIPPWALTLITTIIGLGFPIVVFVGWAMHGNSKVNDITSNSNLLDIQDKPSIIASKSEPSIIHVPKTPLPNSVVAGFKYDVYISYLPEDNESDQWVTEFVYRLNKELAGTIKDRITIYFDKRAGDWNRSNESEYLNSLIFLPIISQTYCHTQSNAWKSEFVKFKELANQSKFGEKIKLRNGTQSSRILPVKIHDLDQEEHQLLESALKGSLRSIDFVYSENGINRPLRYKDDELLSGKYQILYRNQINKVALAVKDIVLGAMDAAASNLMAEETSTEKQVGANPTLFLAWTSSDLKAKRDEIAIMLERAGFNVLPSTDCPSDDNDFRQTVKQTLLKVDYSVHLISTEYGRKFEDNDSLSYPKHQYLEAFEIAQNPSMQFQMFIWYIQPPGATMKPLQQAFVSEIRMNINDKMMFSNVTGAFQLVENILAAVRKKKEDKAEVKDIEMFFMYCEDDELEASGLTNQISQEYPLETLNILSAGRENYREISKQQTLKSKLAIVYFKYGAEWAIPFIKQLWREVGGASSPTQLMLVGEDNPKSNQARKFKAPKVICEIVPKEIIPQEITNSYQKL